jgi:alpha-ketoglutaric semialdehyde dehydrogenase
MSVLQANGEPVLIAGRWRPAAAQGVFHAVNPATGQQLSRAYPISSWSDCDAALDAAARAAVALETVSRDRIGDFLARFADRIEARASELVEQAHLETALPRSPRLADVELPRTTNQLRQAAAAARDGSWALPTIDARHGIRSCLAAIGPVVVFGPNNFPFAFSAVAGGDCAAALAAGNPVIAKAHPLHPETSRLLAEEAFSAVTEAGLPESSVQLLYHMDPSSGLRLVSDPRIGASAFTGSREAGLALKAAADAAGKPIYLEMSSINPVVVLPGALAERVDTIAADFAASCLLAGGQFCTNPGLVVLFAGEAADRFVGRVKDTFDAATTPVLLSSGLARALHERIAQLRTAGATLLTADAPAPDAACHPNTLLQVTGARFLEAPAALQREAFGAAALVVLVRDAEEAEQVLDCLEGNLTGSIYSDQHGADEPLYARLAPRIRRRVGRLLNDKMPTGVLVSSAMCHGGPYPATGHPGFTAVGIPASLRRFAALHCYDNVREPRLPDALRDRNPNGRMWRLIDGAWTQADLDD